MKNRLIALLGISLLATGCVKKQTVETVKVICPTGAPAVAFYTHFDDENFETNGTPSNIVSFMNETSPYDAVVIDTVSGIKAINNGAPFKLLSTITFGNFFIASTGHDEDGVMDASDKIVLFGKNQTPDLLFHYIYGTDYDASIEYVTAVSDAAGCLASGKNVATGSDVDYVFVAQPVLFATLNNKNAPTYGKSGVYANIQDEYKNYKEDNEKEIDGLKMENSILKSEKKKLTKSLEVGGKEQNEKLKKEISNYQKKFEDKEAEHRKEINDSE